MRNSIKLEEAAMTLLSIYFLFILDVDLRWWWFIPLFFSPDISLIGLIMKNNAGRFIYSIFHHKAVAIAVIAAGLLLNINYVQLLGLILFGHSSFDRFLGLGLPIQSEIK